VNLGDEMVFDICITANMENRLIWDDQIIFLSFKLELVLLRTNVKAVFSGFWNGNYEKSAINGADGTFLIPVRQVAIYQQIAKDISILRGEKC
jgi:hypothetical protein